LIRVPEGKVCRAWIALKVGFNLNQVVVRMLERDQPWRRRGAGVEIQLSLYCTEYEKNILG
jgi:hypothetical protein